jgi:hypothetical protein
MRRSLVEALAFALRHGDDDALVFELCAAIARLDMGV